MAGLRAQGTTLTPLSPRLPPVCVHHKSSSHANELFTRTLLRTPRYRVTTNRVYLSHFQPLVHPPVIETNGALEAACPYLKRLSCSGTHLVVGMAGLCSTPFDGAYR